MAIPWTPVQRKAVAAVLRKYLPKTNRCVDAARKTLPIARACDHNARAMRITPAGHGRFVLPKVPLDGDWWRFHVTVEAKLHYVDALTGPDGTHVEAYFKAHWQEEDEEAFRVTEVDLEEAAR